MPRRLTVVSLASLLVAGTAVAQEGMSRAQRDADNPLRMIIEASKIRRNAAGDGERTAKPAEPRAAEVRPVARPAARAGAAQPAAAAAESGAAVATIEPAAPARVPEPETAPPPAPVVETAAAVPPPAAPPPLPAPVQVPPPAAPEPLRLAQMIEPVTPRALAGKLRGDVEVVVSFTVNPDGSVSEPAIRSSSQRGMDNAVLDAVRQWRYEPIVVARAHSVQLVLRQGD